MSELDGPASDPGNVAGYVEAMARDLKAMADRSGLGFLAYLLAMVVDEAATVIENRQSDLPPTYLS